MPVAGLGSKPARLQRAAAAVPAHSHPYRFMGHRAPRSVEQRQTICRWKLILEEVALVWNTFRKATTYVLAAKFNYGFYRQLLRIQKPMTIAKRQEMIETRSGIVTAPGPHAHEYQADPRRCPHPTPRRWAGRSGNFCCATIAGLCGSSCLPPTNPRHGRRNLRGHTLARPFLRSRSAGPTTRTRPRQRAAPAARAAATQCPQRVDLRPRHPLGHLGAPRRWWLRHRSC
jgi:hypothetical protein